MPAQHDPPLLYNYNANSHPPGLQNPIVDTTAQPTNVVVHDRVRFSANDPNRPSLAAYGQPTHHVRRDSESSSSPVMSNSVDPPTASHIDSELEPDYVFKIHTADTTTRPVTRAYNTTVNDRLGMPNTKPQRSQHKVVAPAPVALTETELRRLNLNHSAIPVAVPAATPSLEPVAVVPLVPASAPIPVVPGTAPIAAVRAIQPIIPDITASASRSSQDATAKPIVPIALPIQAPPNKHSALPDGWIAHIDQASGLPYYIHLPTQHTQWEPPASATLPHPNADQSSHTSSSGSYTDTGESEDSDITPNHSLPDAPDILRPRPANGVYFGPYLRYTNMDLGRGLWLASILLVTHIPQPPTIHLHQTIDLSPNPRQLKANPIHSHKQWTFYRYDVVIQMEDNPTKWVYAVSSHLECNRHEFLVAGKHDLSWRFVTYSGNDFAPGVTNVQREKLGGAESMWKDMRQKHVECGGFHVQIGLGGQICADKIWQDIPMLAHWTTISDKKARTEAIWNEALEHDVTTAYFYYYTSHFDQPEIRDSVAQIPCIFTVDDADVFDGYGSYPDYIQQSIVCKNVSRIATDMFLLFQHHTTHEILRTANSDLDVFTITGAGWHFIKYLGPAVVVIGPDTRSERSAIRVISGPTYQGLLPKVAMLPSSVQHCIWLMPVPMVYPRLHNAQHIAHNISDAKTGGQDSLNMLGRKIPSQGLERAKDVMTDGFLSVKRALGKSGVMSNMTNAFGEFDVIHELRDMWTDDSKDLERTYIVRTLQKISHNKGLRMTFLSGSVNCAGAGFLHDVQHQNDHKTVYQIIAPSLINAPLSDNVIRLLDTDPALPLYIPVNGERSAPQGFLASQLHLSNSVVSTDTQENMLDVFIADPDGTPRESRRLMSRRGYVMMVAFDPEAQHSGTPNPFDLPSSPHVQFQDESQIKHKKSKSKKNRHAGPPQLRLAADFMVQAQAKVSSSPFGTVRYGPVVVPGLVYGQ